MGLPTRTIAGLGMEVTRLGIGALPMGPLQRGLTPEEGGRVIRRALERGVTFIDTATAYGTYGHVAAALRGWTEPVVLSTKTHARDDARMAREHIDKALREMDREYVDIMLCHCARALPTRDLWGPSLEELAKARERGDARMIGISSHTIEGVRIVAEDPDIDAVHPLINMAGLGITDGGPQEMLAAIRKAHAAGKLVYAMKALGGGNLVPRREEALRFALAVDEIDVVVVGMVTPQEVEWNVRFFAHEPIPEDLAGETAFHTKRLNILEFLCQGCAACVEHCENDALRVEDGVARVDPGRCILCGYCGPHCPQFAIRMV